MRGAHSPSRGAALSAVYRRTGRTVTITGLRDLEVGATYVVNANERTLILEQVESEEVLPCIDEVQVGDYHLDSQSRIATRADGRAVYLTRNEWRVLDALIRRFGHAVPNAVVLKEVWGENYAGDPQLTRIYVSRLRAKMPGIPLATIHSYGYRLGQEVAP